MKDTDVKVTLWTSRNSQREGLVSVDAALNDDMKELIQATFNKKIDDEQIRTYSACEDNSNSNLARVFG